MSMSRISDGGRASAPRGRTTLALALIATCAVASSVATQTAARLRGDVSGEGTVSAVDALAILSHIVGKPLPAGYTALPNGDADGNGTLSVHDASIVLRHAVGRDVSEYPIGQPLPRAVAVVEVLPGSAPIAVGGGMPAIAVLRDADGLELEERSVSWSSSRPAIASVDGDGYVTMHIADTATIMAESEGQTGVAHVRGVRAAHVEMLSLSGFPLSGLGLQIGEVEEVLIRAIGGDDSLYIGPPAWFDGATVFEIEWIEAYASGGAAVSSILAGLSAAAVTPAKTAAPRSRRARVRGVAAGFSMLKLALDNAPLEIVGISVAAPPVVRLTIESLPPEMRVGDSYQPRAYAYSADDRQVDVEIEWDTSDWYIAEVQFGGQINAKMEGEVTITARYLNHTDSRTVRVLPAALGYEGELVDISAGWYHSCAVSTVGAAFCWGNNEVGQLGDASGAFSSIPVPVYGATGFASVSAGGWHTCAITEDGLAYCWGAGSMLGAGNVSDSRMPLAVSGNLEFVSLSAGFSHTCGVTKDKRAYCWGWGGEGRLGNGSTDWAFVPERVPLPGDVTAVSAGTAHACALTSDGRAYCWGAGGNGQLGNGAMLGSATPVAVSGGLTLKSITVGDGHSCGLTLDGAAYCWGYGYRLGAGTSANSAVPIRVSTTAVFQHLDAGSTSTCGSTATGELHCWTWSPALTAGVSVSKPSAGASHQCALTSDRRAVCRGSNYYGQLGIGPRYYETYTFEAVLRR